MAVNRLGHDNHVLRRMLTCATGARPGAPQPTIEAVKTVCRVAVFGLFLAPSSLIKSSLV
jgi:hypothetical protein